MQNKDKKEQNSSKSKKTNTTKSNADKTKNIKEAKQVRQSEVATQQRQSFLKTVFSSVAFWTFLLLVFVLVVGFVFWGKGTSPQNAKSAIQSQQEIRYGNEGRLVLELDKKVSFDKGEVVWVVDGVEVKRGSTKQNKSFFLDYSFGSVGNHKVRAEVDGYPNLTCETDVQVKKPLLVIDVQNATKTYGQENPVAKYNVSGFVDDDSMDTLKLQIPQFDATKESCAGEYGIKPISHEKYDVVAKGGKLVVEKKLLQISSDNGTKIYDGNTKVTELTFEVSGKIGDDEVSVDVQDAHYVDKNVGKNKGIKIKKATLKGADAKNYILPKDPVASGQIVAKNIRLKQVEPADKYYDGGNAVTFDNLGAFDGVVSGDDVGVGQIIARFETPSAGQNKRVVVDKIVLSGKDAKNYIAELPQDLTAQIKGMNNNEQQTKI